jgi:ABC-type Fe3+ transport system permease subunit
MQASLDHFSSSQVLLLFMLMLLMMAERMLYRTRKSYSDAGTDWSQHTLTIKLVIYACLVLFVHVQCGFYFPLSQGIKLNNNLSLLFYYTLWAVHLVYAGL